MKPHGDRVNLAPNPNLNLNLNPFAAVGPVESKMEIMIKKECAGGER
jgi:hypothetical protein